MTATVVGVPTPTTGGAGTSLTVNLPASLTPENLLVMVLGFWTTAPSGPLGWTFSHVTADTASMRFAVYTRLVVGGEGSTVTVSGYVADDPRTAMVVQVSHADSVDVIDSARLSSAPYNCPALTTTSANDLVLVSAFSETSGTATFDDLPAGTTTLAKVKSSAVGGYSGIHVIGSRAQAGIGSTGTTAVTATGDGMSTSLALLTLAIKSSASDSSVVGSPTTTTGGTGTGLTVNLPASPTPGNLLVMILGFWTTAPSDPSGWTLAHLTADTASMRFAVYLRPATGSESSTVSVSGYVADDPRTAMVVQISGANSVDVVSSVRLAAPSYDCPAVVTTVAADLVLVSAFTETSGTATFDDLPAGTTTLAKIKSSVVSGYAGIHVLGSRAQVSPGSTGITTVTATGTGMATSVALLTLAIKSGSSGSANSIQFFRLL